MNSQNSCCKDKKNCPLGQQNSANGQFFSTNWELELELVTHSNNVTTAVVIAKERRIIIG